MIGRWTVWVALLCAVIAGYLCFASWRADGLSFMTVVWGLVVFAMLDAAWMFGRISRRRRRKRADAQGTEADADGGE
ncbi:hypothetical protein [Streptomonospora litoralis]|uniref:Uncharacterized protein n=1 Tax=Streptomonospora litoralis TaxID=2498135 RepID=A0A4V0ZKB6_9ACTN|nr:hypothetical protein [Streptomonospora litoralis]QBI56412.1 hypothetical protein EKD16_23300 [Streptomonospora litoralis]